MRAKELSIEDVCIACHSVESNIVVSQHPYFFGGICELCKVGELAATHKTQALIIIVFVIVIYTVIVCYGVIVYVVSDGC